MRLIAITFRFSKLSFQRKSSLCLCVFLFCSFFFFSNAMHVCVCLCIISFLALWCSAESLISSLPPSISLFLSVSSFHPLESYFGRLFRLLWQWRCRYCTGFHHNITLMPARHTICTTPKEIDSICSINRSICAPCAKIAKVAHAIKWLLTKWKKSRASSHSQQTR